MQYPEKHAVFAAVAIRHNDQLEQDRLAAFAHFADRRPLMRLAKKVSHDLTGTHDQRQLPAILRKQADIA